MPPKSAGKSDTSSSKATIWAAIIGLIGTISAALLGNSGVLVNILPGAPTKTITVTAPPASHATVNSAPSSTSSAIPVVSPKNDADFTIKWHGTSTIGSSGARVTDSGFQAANQQDYDILYQPSGADKGWHENSNNSDNGDLFVWDGSGTPNPAFCSQEYFSGNMSGAALTPDTGSKYCYVDSNGLVAYMQVTSVDSNGITLAAWIWDPASHQ